MNLLMITVSLTSLLAVALGATCSLSSPKKVTFTNYWVAVEGTKDEDPNGNEVTLSGPKTVPLKTCDGKTTIAMTNKLFADKCSLEGTCKLADGR